jgi:hypothetical protein
MEKSFINKAVSNVVSCANIYDKELNNRNLLFIIQDNRNIDYVETSFKAENFQHLTGISYKNPEGGINSINFYKQCVEKSLKTTDIYINSKKTAVQISSKLEALKETTALHKTARMVGDFNNNGKALKTDKLAGNVSACMGFIPLGQFYIPNTNIHEDIRKKIDYSMPILVTLRKDMKDEKYTEITHIKKGLDLSELKLPPEILSKLTDEAKEQLNQKNIPLEKEAAPPPIAPAPVSDDFVVTRHIGQTFTVAYGKMKMTMEYELLRGSKEAEVAAQIAEDFSVSLDEAEKLFEKAANQNAVENEVGGAEPDKSTPALEKVHNIEVDEEINV